ncbi:MAG TPA: IS4 family transposase [Pseudonocardiaceae bacterium]|nr:IS4 family transposase [Pseudonocardiaceae bacterium]
MAGVTREARSAADRLPDRVSIGVLARMFPAALVDEVIDEAGAREQRKRSLPTRLTVYVTLAMWLFMGSGYDTVVRQLVEGLRWSRRGWGTWRVPSTGSITKARTRLGPQPLRLLFDRVAGPVGIPETAGVFWRGLRVTAMDGSTLDIPDTPANDKEFGRPTSQHKPGPYPQVRLVGLAECGSQALINVAFGPFRTGEHTLAADLIDSMTAGMLVLADRNFAGTQLMSAAAATGAELLWRMPSNFTLTVEQVLPDGTYLTELTARNGGKGRVRRRLTVRIIEYCVLTTDEDGEQISELFCLATTLTDPATAPAIELAQLYAQRWEFETLLGALKTRQRGPRIVLRSHTPDGVRQELWAMFCVYHALRELIATAADPAGIDPRRISFTHTLRTAGRSLAAPAFPPAPTT